MANLSLTFENLSRCARDGSLTRSFFRILAFKISSSDAPSDSSRCSACVLSSVCVWVVGPVTCDRIVTPDEVWVRELLNHCRDVVRLHFSDLLDPAN